MNATPRKAALLVAGIFALAVVLRLLQQRLPVLFEKESFSGLVADGPQYFLLGYHILAIVFFLVILFTKRLWLSIPVCFGYFLLHLYSIWLRSQGCYLGGDVCPERPIIAKLLERLDWMDWVAIPVLIALFIIQFIEIARRRKVGP